ncbi:hypothetical protein V7S43_014668 [Phytophthora oleae]|uniref:Uncharacterized protein n=1 Tax=Phytophthora oleae TaxID=2107226 RepID=A0ABD3F2N4_9STRA
MLHKFEGKTLDCVIFQLFCAQTANSVPASPRRWSCSPACLERRASSWTSSTSGSPVARRIRQRLAGHINHCGA